MTETMKFLVTGATGTVGRHVVAQLVAAGHEVRALTRNPVAEFPEGVERFVGDLTDTDTLTTAFDGVTGVHLMTVADYAPLPNAVDIAELAAKAGVARVTILQDGFGPGAVEEAIGAAGLGWTRLAPVEFMGNALEWTESIRDSGEVRDGFPDSPSAMVHEADIAAVAVAALTEPGHTGKTYPITGPEALTTTEKVRRISAGIGRELRFVELTRDETMAEWRAAGFGDDDMAFFVQMRTDPPVEGYTVLPTVPDVTGRPARTFDQWVAENAGAFRSA